MPLTHSDIAEIIRLVDQSTLDEFTVEVGDLTVEVRRKGAAAAVASATPAPAAPAVSPALPAPVPPTPPVPAAPAPESAPAAAGEPILGEGQVAVRSPMVGTFYRRPSPDEPPYVDVGSEVEVDAPLGLVEVMKLYTTIYAKTPGRIARVCANDAELVEYDQILFIIDPV
ncbi:MAG: acetyl-CoA carboxylase biotin carboxyl carrier protein [Chromatiales bacterium]|nr:acetyl-CoA carboxylase biotin carboxyl carrier protein [Chromatiales bacterium]